MQNTGQNNLHRHWPRAIFSAIVLGTALALFGTYLVLLGFTWASRGNVEVTEWLDRHWWLTIPPLILLWILVGITIVDLFKTRGNSQRTWELAFFVFLIHLIAIVWYWSQQLRLALRGNGPDGLVFRFSFRTMLIAFAVWSLTLFILIKLYQSWPINK
jgi:hypothetical protein